MKDFNWVQFHKDLDTALAILLEENKIHLPSETTLIQFLELNNAKANPKVKPPIPGKGKE